MSEEKLGKLRGKLKEITEHIDEADSSKTDAVHANVEALARLEKLQVDLQSSGRRTQMVAKEVKDVSERLVIAEDKLAKTTTASEEDEVIREELEAKESEGDERVEELEVNLKEMSRSVESNEIKVVDGERKVKVCENDIAGLQQKADKFEGRVGNLEETIENHGKKLDELEEREGEMGDKETINEEKVDFLDTQLKETEARADAAERMNAVLNNTLFESQTEIEGWVKKTAEIESTMILMDDLADDPAYDLSKRYGADGARASVTASSVKAQWGARDEEAKEASRPSSRASSRGGRGLAKPPKEPTPEPESEEESEEEEEAPPPPAPKPAPAPEPESEEESEEESEDEDSD